MKGFDDTIVVYSGEVLKFSIALTLLFQKLLKVRFVPFTQFMNLFIVYLIDIMRKNATIKAFFHGSNIMNSNC